MVLGDRATTDKTTRRFRDIPAILAELNIAGLHAQTINDLFTLYVGAASHHVLRMSLVTEDEAKSFDTEVVGFWSQLIQRDATSPQFHLPLKLGGPNIGRQSFPPSRPPPDASTAAAATKPLATQSPPLSHITISHLHFATFRSLCLSLRTPPCLTTHVQWQHASSEWQSWWSSLARSAGC